MQPNVIPKKPEPDSVEIRNARAAIANFIEENCTCLSNDFGNHLILVNSPSPSSPDAEWSTGAPHYHRLIGDWNEGLYKRAHDGLNSPVHAGHPPDRSSSMRWTHKNIEDEIRILVESGVLKEESLRGVHHEEYLYPEWRESKQHRDHQRDSARLQYTLVPATTDPEELKAAFAKAQEALELIKQPRQEAFAALEKLLDVRREEGYGQLLSLGSSSDMEFRASPVDYERNPNWKEFDGDGERNRRGCQKPVFTPKAVAQMDLLERLKKAGAIGFYIKDEEFDKPRHADEIAHRSYHIEVKDLAKLKTAASRLKLEYSAGVAV